MPTMPATQCAHYRCKAPTVPGSIYCQDHAPTRKARPDKVQADAAYNTTTWRSIRAIQLSRQPLCQACALAGRVTAAQHVDHVIPWKKIGPQAFTSNLFQSLCAPCHSVKTGLESRGIFRHYAATGHVDYFPGTYQAALAACE